MKFRSAPKSELVPAMLQNWSAARQGAFAAVEIRGKYFFKPMESAWPDAKGPDFFVIPGGTPPPWGSSEIIELGGNLRKIYGAQSFTGKILISGTLPVLLKALSAVFAFARMNGFFAKRKVRCHKRSVFLVEKFDESFVDRAERAPVTSPVETSLRINEPQRLKPRSL